MAYNSVCPAEKLNGQLFTTRRHYGVKFEISGNNYIISDIRLLNINISILLLYLNKVYAIKQQLFHSTT